MTWAVVCGVTELSFANGSVLADKSALTWTVSVLANCKLTCVVADGVLMFCVDVESIEARSGAAAATDGKACAAAGKGEVPDSGKRTILA